MYGKGDLLTYLQCRGICERWVMEWYFYNRNEMRDRDPALYRFAKYIYLKYIA
jgi:hypothetical protein